MHCIMFLLHASSCSSAVQHLSIRLAHMLLTGAAFSSFTVRLLLVL
jgi:hypothetical protein